jgi:two-component sensor histidine kinase
MRIGRACSPNPQAKATEKKMLGMQSGRFDLNEKGLALLLGELDHRVRNLLMTIEAMVRQTQSKSVEDYRAKLIDRIADLYGFYQLTSRDDHMLGLADLLEHTTRPYSSGGARVRAVGPDLELEPSLALALNLVFHELAANASKYGSLSSPLGRVKIEWNIHNVPDGHRKLAIVWSEHGGPEVRPPQNRGFGSRLVQMALNAYGEARLEFNRTGLACFMLIDPDRAERPGHLTAAPIHDDASERNDAAPAHSQ